MTTRFRNDLRLGLAVLACVGALAGAASLALAQQPTAPAPTPAAQPPKVQAPAAGAEDKRTSAGPADDASAPADETKSGTSADAAAKPPAGAKGSPQRFEPTEKVRADFDVAFPVDI